MVDNLAPKYFSIFPSIIQLVEQVLSQIKGEINRNISLKKGRGELNIREEKEDKKKKSYVP